MVKKIYLFSSLVICIGSLTLAKTSLRNDNNSHLLLENIEALSSNDGGESGYSCSATADCIWAGQNYGSISCTGTSSCISGYRYVSCDGKRSECTID